MAGLLVASGFCSASEAACFFLSRIEQRRLAKGNPRQQLVARLLQRPERLLTAVLFWNLLVNLSYFTVDSILSLQLQRAGHGAQAGLFAAGTLLALILAGEMLPKNLAVLAPAKIATWVAPILSLLVRALDPVAPALRWANILSRRLLSPRFEAEPYLQVHDLERALRLSTADATLVEREQQALENIVNLSEMRADELMRPRTLFRLFRAPVALADLEGWLPPSGYLLLSENDSDEVSATIALRALGNVPREHLERYAQPVVYVPWCATVGKVLDLLAQQRQRVAAVVNEFGETIGILPKEDIVETIFSRTASRSERLFRRLPIRSVADGVWHVTGLAGIRRLARRFDVLVPPTHSATVSGVLQELLERFPQPDDRCQWGPFHFRVLDAPPRGQLLVELTMPEEAPT